MAKIDVIILTNNEEDVIEDAIKSVNNWAENIIILDAGSTDNTLKIAERYKVEVVRHDFENFSDQRNFAIKKVKSDWVMYLDSDERVTLDFKKELEDKIKSSDFSGFEIKRKTYYFGKDWGLVDKILRVFKVKDFKKWEGVVHETARVDGKIGIIQSPINHFTHRNLQQMVRKTNEWSEFESKLRLDSHHPRMTWWRFIRVMTTEFFRSYFKEKGFKNGTYGLVEAIYQSYSIFITYAKLWEKQTKSQ